MYSLLEYSLKASAVKGKDGWGKNELFFLLLSMGFLLCVALKYNVNFDARE